MATDWPKVDKFLSEDEIVEVLYARAKDLPGVENFIADGPAIHHHGLGTSVRNEFLLWHPENSFTMKDYIPELRDGVDYNPKHADNTSGRILDKLHEKLTQYHADKEAR